MKDDLVTIGKISKPHGLQGALKVLPFFDLSELFSQLSRVWLIGSDREGAHEVDWARRSGRFHILKLRDVNEIAAAEGLRGWQVAVSRDELPPLQKGRHYTFQLIGLRVVTEEGKGVGEISEVLPMPAHDVYVVDGSFGEVLVPAVKEIVCDIDLDGGRIIIRDLNGLLE
jgi:16S rRNA processing protein RimM